MNQQTHIIIFAKAPLPGFAKTRLIPSLGKNGAAKLAKKLFDHALIEALAADIGTVELSVTPGFESDYWDTISLPEHVLLTEQGEGDLGERMARASKRALEKNSAVMLMGTDCPSLDRNYLRDASQMLASYDACLAPVSDGGYALIGLHRFHSSIFSDIPWSTDKVSQFTLQRFRTLAWNVAELKQLHDIDEPKDLIFLPNRFRVT